MAVEDAKKAIDIGCTAIMGFKSWRKAVGWGQRSPFDQVSAIRDAVGDKLEIIFRWWSKKRNSCF